MNYNVYLWDTDLAQIKFNLGILKKYSLSNELVCFLNNFSENKYILISELGDFSQDIFEGEDLLKLKKEFYDFHNQFGFHNDVENIIKLIEEAIEKKLSIAFSLGN